MNLRFLTAGASYLSQNGYSDFAKIGKLSNSFTPVCLLPKIKVTYNTNDQLDYLRRNTLEIHPSKKDKSITFSYVSSKLEYNLSRKSLQDNFNKAVIEYDRYMVSDIETKIDLSYIPNMQMSYLMNFFINTPDQRSFNRNYVRYTFESTRLIIGKGSLYVVKNNVMIPLVVLMVKDSYIHDFKIANTLDLDIDTTQLEFWINNDIEYMFSNSPNIRSLISRFMGVLRNDDIKVYVKSNLTALSSGIFVPKLSTISDRLDWLKTVKNSYINDVTNTQELPVKEYHVDMPIIETVNTKFKSRNLNNFIKGNNKDVPKQKKINKFQLV